MGGERRGREHREQAGQDREDHHLASQMMSQTDSLTVTHFLQMERLRRWDVDGSQWVYERLGGGGEQAPRRR